MCGIVGAVAQRNIVPILLEGLRRLEYRGYDSCGVAVINGGLQRARSVARVAELEREVQQTGFSGATGIAHTRWATHGAPATNNAHPHFSPGRDGQQRVGLVHNGIIENFEELRDELKARGYHFESQTDTEVVAHLVNDSYDGDLLRTVQRVIKRLTGAFAIAVFCKDEPERVVGARLGCPLIVGLGQGENFIASDAMALAGTTDQIIYLEEGDVVDVQRERVRIFDRHDSEVERRVQTVTAYSGAIDLGPYRHYMQKEIFEQPRAITDTLQGVQGFAPDLFGKDAEEVFRQIDGIQILACGTSYYAGMTAKYWLEDLAGLPTNVEIASEFRYRKPAVNPNALVVVISQSGETADTLAALKYAKELGHKHSIAICNVATSAMVRETELAYLTRAGAEIGVASTKAFTTQLTALFLLTLTLAKLRHRLSPEGEQQHLKNLRHLPTALQSVLALEPQIIAWAEAFARKENALFLGRGLHYPIALEGALKLKEISYIHAEAYPAGELKHGPLA
ncbi:MAG: glutamine--fructose-6-phosphate transaminase (isomerizing), partial [Lacisediminimonas sp.]|nr:glutamine--fructose-6-phosphate transaminase (isomerizing) [Lacisediminimonas sp.]